MIKKIYALSLISTFIFCGCSSDKNEPNIKFSDISSAITDAAKFEDPSFEYLTETDTAQRYGISTDDIEEGIVYSTSNENKPDKIILVKARDENTLENVERALSSEVIGLTDSWENNEAEFKKVEEHVLKTTDNYVILIVSENASELEETFDSIFKPNA